MGTIEDIERQLDSDAIDANVARAPELTAAQADQLRRLLAPAFAAAAKKATKAASPQNGDGLRALTSPKTPNDVADDNPSHRQRRAATSRNGDQ
jgi:hypothetical protein